MTCRPSQALVSTTAIALVLAGLSSAPVSAEEPNEGPSGFGCHALEDIAELQMIEGKDGMFFRILADLRLQHAFTDQTVERLAAMSKALAAHGTTLVYVPLPTKSQVHPDLVPERAALYGFDAGIASQVYDDVVRRLEKKGVVAVDIATPMRSDNRSPSGDYSFFKADFHWTAHGADVAAKAIGDRLKTLPAYEDITPVRYEMEEVIPDRESSSMRDLLQKHCLKNVPPVTAKAYRAVRQEDAAAGGGGLDIFGAAEHATTALIGTSYSDKPISNFADFLQYRTGVPVENYSISGGNQFGSILSYITSREFQESRPRFLIWENPIYNNLGQYGDAPWQEVLAAAGGECTTSVAATRKDDRTVEADLASIKLSPGDVLLADIGRDISRKAQFTFTGTDGQNRVRSVERGDRLRSTGRYFLSLGGFPAGSFGKVSVSFDAAVDETTTLSICKTKTGEQS
ncbi:alginate biosynthesis protein [Rhizobium sp. AAP43]|uniref:alginate O-acetyltransferase AlgX-related protein n=1 Tax=Rhizobium sp. AAP43 TaxID=1523420 RepID=UPI0006B8A47D|nr:alginate biosynthesis protein [Rhizobium sp. AAP43]KPF46086.1 alginate biosynthesis protein [Rhizobium sp. AAP43]